MDTWGSALILLLSSFKGKNVFYDPVGTVKFVLHGEVKMYN